MKKVFISFQTINNNKATGMVKFLLPILNGLETNLIESYYVSSVNSYKGKLPIKEIGFLYKLVFFITRVIRKVFKNISYGKIRYIQEFFFDLFLSFKIKEPTLLVSSAYLNRTVKKNRTLGGISIFVAGNPDDREIYKVMKKEQETFNVVINDAYTYRKRIDFIGTCLASYDHIMTFTKTEYETYSKNIDKTKLSYKESFIIPQKKIFEDESMGKSEKLTFCYIAHTVWLKGLTYLVDAFSKMIDKNVQLLIGGTISNQVFEYIESKCSSSNNIKIIGFVDDLNKFYRGSHVCIVPSLLDAGPATVTEALYCGLPVIVTEGCGTKTLINEGENGFVIPVGNTNRIVEKIDWFIENQDKIDSMSYNAKQTIIAIDNSERDRVLTEHFVQVINEVKKGKE